MSLQWLLDRVVELGEVVATHKERLADAIRRLDEHIVNTSALEAECERRDRDITDIKRRLGVIEGQQAIEENDDRDRRRSRMPNLINAVAVIISLASLLYIILHHTSPQ
jgi:hypothetical protein